MSSPPAAASAAVAASTAPVEDEDVAPDTLANLPPNAAPKASSSSSSSKKKPSKKKKKKKKPSSNGSGKEAAPPSKEKGPADDSTDSTDTDGSDDSDSDSDDASSPTTPAKKKKKKPTQPKTPSSAKASLAPGALLSPGRNKSGKVTYVQMVHDAIASIGDRSGSSVPAICKYMMGKHEHLATVAPNKFKHSVNTAIKAAVKADRFVKVRASYKINTKWVKKEKAALRAKEVEKKAREKKRRKEQEKARQAKKKADAEEKKRKQEEEARIKKEQEEEEARRREELMTPEERAEIEEKRRLKAEAERKKAEAAARAKEIQELLRKRRYPIEDTRLHSEDKEWGVKPPDDVTRRPFMPYIMTSLVPMHKRSGGRTSSAVVNASSSGAGAAVAGEESRGLVSDLMQVYHFFCGDVGFAGDGGVVPPFTVKNLLYAVEEIQNGNSKAARALPPLITHLFLTALRFLTGVEGRHGAQDEAEEEEEDTETLSPQDQRLRADLAKLGLGLNAVSWSDVCVFYMDLMERYYTTDASLDSNVLPGGLLDMSYLVDEDMDTTSPDDGETEENEESDAIALPDGYYGYLGHPKGALARAFYKLSRHDPWNLAAEEIMALLRALTDDIISTHSDLADDIAERGTKLYELLKAKKAADSKFRKVRLAYEGPKQPTKSAASKKDGDEKSSGDTTVESKDTGGGGEKTDNDETKSKGSASESTETNAEKPSAPVVFKPTATKRQFETAERAMNKANEAYEKGLRKLTQRTEPIGYDRHHNAVYFFLHDPEMLYVEVIRQTSSVPSEYKRLHPTLNANRSWHAIETKSLFDEFLSSLDVRGKRERSLHEDCTGGFTNVRRFLFDDRKEEEERKKRRREREDLERRLENANIACAAEEEGGRRSGRLASIAQEELTKVKREMELTAEMLKTAEKPQPIDYRSQTGLEAISDFDAKKLKGKPSTRRSETAQVEAENLCSKLWCTDEEGGAVGLLITSLIDLESQCQSLSPWERDDMSRSAWINTLIETVGSWNGSSIFKLGPVESDDANDNEEELDDADASLGSKRGSSHLNDENGSGKRMKQEMSSAWTVPLLLSTLKQPLLDLEARVFTITGLEMATAAVDEAGETSSVDDSSTNDEEDEAKRAQLRWKKQIFSLNQIPAKRSGLCRGAIVAAITIARKAHLNDVVTELKSALHLFNPTAAGEAKAAALDILEKHGGYEKPDDDDDDSVSDDVAVNATDARNLDDEAETDMVSLLCEEAMACSGALGNDDDADRVDWQEAVRSCKTISKLAMLTRCFLKKSSEMLSKAEADREAFLTVLQSSKTRSSKSNQKKGRHDTSKEIWCDAKLTDSFVMAKIVGRPWWPARICEAREPSTKESLSSKNLALISFVGETAIYLVDDEEDVRPFSADQDDVLEDLSQYDPAVVKSFHESVGITKRICHHRGLLQQSPWAKKSVSRVFVEEKKSTT